MNEIKTLIKHDELIKRIKTLASQIRNDYGENEITLICILKGAVFFTTELAKNICGNITMDFIRVSSYDGENSSGEITMKLDLKDSIKEKNVIVVEDIIDSGRTLKYLKNYLMLKEPKSIKICVLLDKKEKRVCDIEPDYVGFTIPDKFVVGYGLDYNELYRNLPYIGYIENQINL